MPDYPFGMRLSAYTRNDTLVPDHHVGHEGKQPLTLCPWCRKGFVALAGCPISRALCEKWGFAETYLRTACASGSRRPASLASFAALSVDSQVKSASLRPK